MATNGNLSPSLRRHSSTMSSRRPSHGALEGASPIMTTADANMPVRHPRPLTAAELHLELEKEQEAVVNRLTRELSVLRAQHSASVASNASQNSTLSTTPALDGSLSHPTPTRQNRSSSTASRGSISGVSATQPNTLHHPQPSAPLAGVSQASHDRAAAVGATTGGAPISRSTSIRSTSGQNTPALTPASAALPHRPSISQAMSAVSTAGSFAHLSSGPVSPYTSASSTDAATARAELDTVKAENEALRQRVRALERALRSRRNSVTSEASIQREPSLSRPSVSAWAANAATNAGTSVAGPRERSESQSTTASSRRPDVLEREDSIRVGESAANVGLGLK